MHPELRAEMIRLIIQLGIMWTPTVKTGVHGVVMGTLSHHCIVVALFSIELITSVKVECSSRAQQRLMFIVTSCGHAHDRTRIVDDCCRTI